MHVGQRARPWAKCGTPILVSLSRCSPGGTALPAEGKECSGPLNSQRARDLQWEPQASWLQGPAPARTLQGSVSLMCFYTTNNRMLVPRPGWDSDLVQIPGTKCSLGQASCSTSSPFWKLLPKWFSMQEPLVEFLTLKDAWAPD